LRPGGGQPDLFAQARPPEGPALSPALEALAGVKPDELSPREALETLYRLRKLLDE
jgi:DNA mismatch repair protein MutS